LKDIKLQVGDSYRLKHGLFGITSTSIIYGGMPDNETFSVVVQTADGYRSSAYNLYYHKDRKTVTISGTTFTIMCVSTSELWMQSAD